MLKPSTYREKIKKVKNTFQYGHLYIYKTVAAREKSEIIIHDIASAVTDNAVRVCFQRFSRNKGRLRNLL